MSSAGDTPTSDRAEEYYGYFMTGLFGLLDDAELSGYSAEGIEHLRRAQEAFWREFRERHPTAWSRGQERPSSPD
jgi:hypothetical protein